MAVTEADGGGGKKKLPSWDKVAKSDPRDIAGTKSYRPPPAAGPLPGMKLDRDRVQKLTPYTLPVLQKETVESAAGPAVPGARAGRPMPESNEPYVPGAAGGRGYSRTVAIPGQEAEVTEERDPTLEEPQKRGGRSYQLTWDEYNKLSKDQRAAVDFNTMLLQAREKDLNTDYSKLDGGGPNAEYEAAVDRMFGERGGSETYAPETMAVLRSIDFKASGETLDDFLSLDAAVSAKDLKDFEIAPVEKSVMYQDSSAKASGALLGEEQAAQRTTRLQQALAKGGELIQNWKATTAANRSSLSVRYGGTANAVTPALGFGDDETSQYFRMAADALSRDLSPEDLDQVWGALNERLKPEELVAFKKFADDITRDAISFRPPEWTQGEGVFFNPQLIRTRLGLDQGGNDGR